MQTCCQSAVHRYPSCTQLEFAARQRVRRGGAGAAGPAADRGEGRPDGDRAWAGRRRQRCAACYRVCMGVCVSVCAILKRLCVHVCVCVHGMCGCVDVLHACLSTPTNADISSDCSAHGGCPGGSAPWRVREWADALGAAAGCDAGGDKRLRVFMPARAAVRGDASLLLI